MCIISIMKTHLREYFVPSCLSGILYNAIKLLKYCIDLPMPNFALIANVANPSDQLTRK